MASWWIFGRSWAIMWRSQFAATRAINWEHHKSLLRCMKRINPISFWWDWMMTNSHMSEASCLPKNPYLNSIKFLMWLCQKRITNKSWFSVIARLKLKQCSLWICLELGHPWIDLFVSIVEKLGMKKVVVSSSLGILLGEQLSLIHIWRCRRRG